MDLLKLIKEKASYFSTSKDDIGILNVVTHIEIAEKHFEGGKSGEDYLFNDVIYRSNQAFEGALKEAYRIIHGNNPNNLSPYKIEKYFEDNKILKERVLQLFTNYRTEWRNKSTHDYKLYFSEQEALLAVVSISAFVNILLDQMIEKKSYDKETTNIKSLTLPLIEVQSIKSLVNRSIELLISFSGEISNIVAGSVLPRIMESVLMGSMAAYLNNYALDIEVLPEYAIPFGTRTLYADFLLQSKNEKVLIEIKNPHRGSSDILAAGAEQIFNYLLLTDINHGILYIPPDNDSEEMNVSSIKRVKGDKEYTVFYVCPKHIIFKYEQASI
jgi:hypothetical protein